MKKFYRWLCFALVLLMITSCTNGNTSDNGTEAPTEAPTEDVGNLIVKNGRAEYSIVYAQGLPESTLAVVDALQTAILEYTGANIKIKEESGSFNDNTKEILIGSVDFAEAKSIKKSLSRDEFVIRSVGKKILIVADSNRVLEEAIYYFIEQLMPHNLTEKNGRVSLAHEDYDGVYMAPEGLQFNGVGIQKYSVVYSQDVPEMKEIAEALALRIGNAFETEIACYEDDEPEREFEFLVGLTNREFSSACFSDAQVPLMSYQLVVGGTKVQLACPGAFSGSEAVTKFSSNYLFALTFKNLRDGVYMKTNLLTVTNQPLTEGSTLRVMTANILADRWVNGRNFPSVPKRAEMVASVLAVYRPDLIGMQETDEPWTQNFPYYLDYLRDWLYLDYGWIENTARLANGKVVSNLTSIVYSKDRFTYVTSAMQEFSSFNHQLYKLRVLTYGIFTKKDNGEKYALINTHYDGGAPYPAKEISEQTAMINDLKSRYQGIHVFCTGDYNNHGDYNILDLQRSANLMDSKDEAKRNGTLINEEPGIPEQIYIDHVFFQTGTTVTRHETIVSDYAAIMSDHKLQYGDFIVQ